MKVAFVGKGGSGKSAISGTFARAVSRLGKPVLAIDSDPMPGMAWSLGITPTDDGLPDEMTMEGGEGQPRWVLHGDFTVAGAVDRFTLRGPDGVRFLQFGKMRGNDADLKRSQHAFSAITHAIDDQCWHLVGDLPAGTRQAYFGWARYADTLIVVVEPSVKSIMSARRLAKMADPTGRRAGVHVPTVVAIANKVTASTDAEEIGRRTGLSIIATVPVDEAFAAAERAGRPPIDDAATGPAVRAIVSLATQMQRADQPSSAVEEEPA